jgi:hypothetical protein
VVRPERLELPAYWFEASRSIRLSYGRTSLIIQLSTARPTLKRHTRGVAGRVPRYAA